MDFVKWWESYVNGQDDISYVTKSRTEIALAAWQAATLAERERAAKVADNQVFEDHVDCEGCITAKEIATTIRKGEGV